MRNARVAPMAVNATRPGLELSRLRNAVRSQTQRQPPLSATVRRNKNERKRKRGGSRGGEKELAEGTGPAERERERAGALYHRGRETRRRSAPRWGDTIHLPASKLMMQKIHFIFSTWVRDTIGSRDKMLLGVKCI